MPSAFEDAVSRGFAFLERSFAYRRVQTTQHTFRFESDRVFINLIYDAFSFELGLEIGLLEHEKENRETIGPPFNLGEILRCVGAPIADELSFLQASTPERLSTAIEKLAQAVERYLAPLLLGDTHAFSRLMQFRDHESAAYEASERLRRARLAASTAWAAKDYKTYISALAPVRLLLTPGEAKKLAYAERK